MSRISTVETADNDPAAAATPTVRVAAGQLLLANGVAPIDSVGDVASPDNVVAQTRVCLHNLGATLAAQGAGFADVATLTVYVAEGLPVDLTVAVDAVAEEFATAGVAPVPPTTVVGVTVLPREGQVVALDAIAAPQQ